MKIYLIRHGEYDHVSDESGLTKLGKKQAKITAKRLSKCKIDKAYTSALPRAIETYEEFKKLKPKISVMQDKDINEIYRKIIGGPVKKGTSKDRERKDKLRADRFWNKLIKNSEDDTIVMFCHGNLIRYYVAKVLEIPLKYLWTKLPISYCSITGIKHGTGGLKVFGVNDTGHLPEKLR